MLDKKFWKIILAALIVLCAFAGLAACNKGDEAKVTKIEVNLPDSVTIGETFSDEVRVTVSFSNGDRRSYPLSAAAVSGFDANKEGYQKITVTYGDMSFTGTVRVIRYFTVTYSLEGEGGRLYGTSVQTLPNGEACDPVQAIPLEGYEFEGWSDGYPNPKRRDDKAVENVTYTAAFKKIVYDLTFYNYDVRTRSFIDPQTNRIDYGQTFTVPDYGCDNVDGYTFLGYVEGKSSLAGIKAAAAVPKNTVKPADELAPQASATYYPVYVARTYSVRYFDMSSSENGDLLFVREGIDYNKTISLYDDCAELWDNRCLNLNLYTEYFDMSWTATSGDNSQEITALNRSILAVGDVRVELRYEYVHVKVRYYDSDGKTLIAESSGSDSPRLNDLLDVYGKLTELLRLDGDYTQKGYTDLKWEYKGDLFNKGDTYVIGELGSIDFVLNKTLRTYQISFIDTYDQSVTGSSELTFGTKLSEGMIADPQSAKFKFRGWFRDADCTIPLNGNAKVDSDVSVYAGWYVPVTLSFKNCKLKYYDTTDGDSEVSDNLYAYVLMYDKFERDADSGRYYFYVEKNAVFHYCYSEELIPTRLNYEFVKWNADSALTTPYAFATTVSEPQELHSEFIIERYNMFVDVPHGTLFIGCGNPAHAQYSEQICLNENGTKVVLGNCADCRRIWLVTDENGDPDRSSGYLCFKVTKPIKGGTNDEKIKFVYYEDVGYENSIIRLGRSSTNILGNNVIARNPKTVTLNGAQVNAYENSVALIDDYVRAKNTYLTVSTTRTERTISVLNSGNTCTFTVDGAEPEAGRLNVNGNNQTLRVYYGQRVTLTLTPNKGCKFANISVRENNSQYNSLPDDPAAEYSVDFAEVKSSISVTSITEAIVYGVETSYAGNGYFESRVYENGKVSEEPDNTGTAVYNKEKAFFFNVNNFGIENKEVVAAISINGEYVYTVNGPVESAPAYGYVKAINITYADEAGYGVRGELILQKIDRDISVHVIFAKSSVNLSVRLDNSNGYFSNYVLSGINKPVTQAQTKIESTGVDVAASFKLTVSAKAGYIVDKVAVNGVEYDVSAKTYDSFPEYLIENLDVVVYFTEETYTISVTKTDGGSVSLLYGGREYPMPFNYRYNDTTEIKLRFNSDSSRGKVISSLTFEGYEFTEATDATYYEVTLPARTVGSIQNFRDYEYSVAFDNRKQTITVKFTTKFKDKPVGQLQIGDTLIDPSDTGTTTATVRYGQNASVKTLFIDGIYICKFTTKRDGANIVDTTDVEAIKRLFNGSEYTIDNIRGDYYVEIEVDISRYTLTYANVVDGESNKLLTIDVFDENEQAIASGSKLIHGTAYYFKITPKNGYDLKSATLKYEDGSSEAVSTFNRDKDDETGYYTSIRSGELKLTADTTIELAEKFATFELTYENHMVGEETIGKIADLKNNGADMIDSSVLMNDIITFNVELMSYYIGKYNIRVIVNDDFDNPLALVRHETESRTYYSVDPITITKNTRIDVYYEAIEISISTTIENLPSGGKVQVNTTHYTGNVSGRITTGLAMTDVTVLLTVGNVTYEKIIVEIKLAGEHDATRVQLNNVNGSKYVLSDKLKNVNRDIEIKITFYEKY